MKKMAVYVLCMSMFFIHPSRCAAQDTPAGGDSTEVAHAMQVFVDAFTNLNWPVFSSCFADDVTAFFPPSARSPYRANGKAEVLGIFQHVFEHAHTQKSAPPYLVIEPKEMRIQMMGTVAIVTFMLNDPDLFGRRTLVVKKLGDKWLIVHLHASGVPLAK